jgi:hypothetical protein
LLANRSRPRAWARNSAGDFLPQLHHACVGFGLVVGEGHIRIVQEAQDVAPALMQAQEEVMADASWLPAAALGAAQRRQRLMKGEPLRHDGVVTSLDTRDQSRFERNATLTGEIDRVTGPTQQDLHLARPVLVIELDQRLQFPQMMSVAQGMQHVLHRVVRLPVVMHHDANDAGHEAAAVGADPIKGEKSSRGDVQPLGLAAEAKAGFVQVLDLGAAHLLAHRIDEAL